MYANPQCITCLTAYGGKKVTQHELERLERLERRRDYLKDKIFAQARSKEDMPFARAELSSLQWAIPIVRRYIELSDEERLQFWGTDQEEA